MPTVSFGRVTLTNDFHDTQTDVHTVDGVLAVRSYQEAVRKLCGIAGCKCGGIRGKQSLPDGTPFYLEVFADSDGPTGLRVIRA